MMYIEYIFIIYKIFKIKKKLIFYVISNHIKAIQVIQKFMVPQEFTCVLLILYYFLK
jgi:hypothetical protein